MATGRWSAKDPRRLTIPPTNSAPVLAFCQVRLETYLPPAGERICRSPEEFKAWSQNLEHEHVMTTFTSYGEVSGHRQAELIRSLSDHRSDDPDVAGQMRNVLAAVERGKVL